MSQNLFLSVRQTLNALTVAVTKGIALLIVQNNVQEQLIEKLVRIALEAFNVRQGAVMFISAEIEQNAPLLRLFIYSI